MAVRKELVIELLKELGIPANCRGYRYLRDAIVRVAAEPKTLLSMTKVLYPTIAHEYGTTASRVERAMRHAIGAGFLRGNLTRYEELFRWSVSARTGKPTNSQFISTLAEYVADRCDK